MTSPIAKTCLVLFLGVVVVFGATVAAAEKGKDKSYEKKECVVAAEDSLASVTILPREVSKSLKIARIPTSEPIPLLIGTYWSCATTDDGLETCRIKLVVCDDDEQNSCFEVP